VGKDKQLQKNQRAIEILRKRIEHFQNIPESESVARQEVFESFKQTIDSQRADGQKLYSTIAKTPNLNQSSFISPITQRKFPYI